MQLTNFERYMKSEFESSPDALRECLSFYARVTDDDIERSFNHLKCPKCAAEAHAQCTPKGWIVVCRSCEHTQKDVSPTRRIACASWIDQKGYPIEDDFYNPWIKSNVFADKRARFIGGRSLSPLLQLLSAVDLYQKIWSMHKQLDEFNALDEHEQERVLLIGFFVKIFRKQVLLIIRERIPQFDFDFASGRLKNYLSEAVQSRLNHWSKMQHFFSNDFSVALHRLLNSMLN